MDLGLLYRALTSHQVDIVAGNSTDGLISALQLTPLEDDRHYFPPYEAVPVARNETLQRHPEVRKALEDLAGRISDEDMRRMNYAVDGEHQDAHAVAELFLGRMGSESVRKLRQAPDLDPNCLQKETASAYLSPIGYISPILSFV